MQLACCWITGSWLAYVLILRFLVPEWPVVVELDLGISDSFDGWFGSLNMER